MEGDWILDRRVWSRIESWLRPSQEPPKSEIPETVKLRQLNDHVFEVCKPTETARPSLEIVFFHGLQLEVSTKPYLTTWLSRDKSELWLNWLPDDIRILIVRYDASARRTETEGRMDMFIVCENLTHALTDDKAHVGQDGCPVILVGHCLGGLVLKEVCVEANSMIALLEEADARSEKLENFLDSVKGVFFYATPHQGAILPDLDASSSRGYKTGPLFKDLSPLNEDTARRNQKFSLLCRKRNWKAAGVGEAHTVSLENFKGFVMQVPEASSRYEIDGVGYYTVPADHFDITHPEDKTSGSFTQLSAFIHQIQPEGQPRFPLGELSVPDHIVGMKSLITSFIARLQSTNCRRWAIVGMGGLGKTTFADILYKNISHKFRYASFVHDVKGQMGDGGHKQQHHQVLQKLILNNLRSGNKAVPATFEWAKLKSKDVMIVLDDVERDFHLEFTEDKASNYFSKKSLIIVTTRFRSSGLLLSKHFEIHDMESLSKSDSKKLLCLKAFHAENVPTGFDGHVERIILKCGNVPLALEVVGSSLYNMNGDEAAWVAMCETITEAQPVNGYRDDGLWTVLRTSYDSLAQKEREMFLDIATCFQGVNVKEARKAWKFMEWGSPDIGWQNLLDRSLVKIKGKFIFMHELLRDLGRSIACSDQRHKLSAYTRVGARMWDSKNLMRDQLSRIKRSRIKVLDTGFGAYDCNFLHGVPELRALWLTGRYKLRTCDSIFPRQLTYVNVRTGSNAVINQICGIEGLRCLVMGRGVKEILPSLGQLVRLEHLELMESEFRVIPIEIGNLLELQHLEIRNCTSLSVLPAEIGRLRKLKHFEISGCDGLTVIPAEFGQLQELHCLIIERCNGLESLPRSITQLRALQDVTIKSCLSLRLPLSLFSDPVAIRTVDCELEGVYEVLVTKGGSQYELSSTKFECTGEQIQLMREIRDKGGLPARVRVRDCGGYTDKGICNAIGCEEGHMQRLRIVSVIGDIDEVCNAFRDNLKTLQTLEILGCPDAVEVNSLGPHLSGLRSLCIKYLPLLKTLPDALLQLRALEVLELKYLPSLAQPPESIGDLRALKILNLGNLSSSKRLPKSVDQLQALRCVEVMGYEIAGAIWEAISSAHFCKLKQVLLDWDEVDAERHLTLEPLKTETLGEVAGVQQLQLCNCGGLVNLLKNVGNLKFLQICWTDLVKLPELIRDLPGLEHLVIHSSRNLAKLKGFVGQVWALGRLDIGLCCCDAEILHSIMDRALEKCLTIKTPQDKSNLRALLASVGQLRNLEHLDVLRQEWNFLPDAIGQLKGLKGLTIVRCYDLKEIPETIALLCSLEWLLIQECSLLRQLPISRSLCRLKRLTIVRCPLKELPITIGDLRRLEHLKIVQCPLTKLPKTIGFLGRLERLIIVQCPLTKLPETIGFLGRLERLTIVQCPLTKLPETIKSLSRLKRLTIVPCPLKELPTTIGDLGRLERLRSAQCPLTKLPKTIRYLGSLERLTIVQCPLKELLISIRRLRKLKRLTIVRCPLKELPNTIGDLGRLKCLRIVQCALKELPVTIWSLHRLERLTIVRCPLKELPIGIGGLAMLEHLTIMQCLLKELPLAIKHLRELKRMTIVQCPLKEVPETIGDLGRLERLTIKQCWGLIRLPLSIGQLYRLEHLTIEECDSLLELPESIKQLESLRHVAVHKCELTTSLADLLMQLPALEDLEIDTRTWVSLAERPGQFGSLKRLTVDTSFMGKLWNPVPEVTFEKGATPEFLRRLGALEELILKSTCVTEWTMKELPKSIGQLKTLKHLEVSDCEAIVELPATIEELLQLKKIVVRRCRKLESWRPSAQHLQHIQELEPVYENPHCVGSFLTAVLQRRHISAMMREGSSLREAALMIQEEQKEWEEPFVTAGELFGWKKEYSEEGDSEEEDSEEEDSEEEDSD